MVIREFKLSELSYTDIIELIESIKHLKVLVIGETIIDEYQYGYTLGKAGKSPVVAFQNENIESYEGGVLAIRNHLKDFCKVDILTGWKQIIKTRYIQNGQKLFETYSYKEDLGYDESEPIENYDLVIVADFGHEFITPNLRKEIIEKSKFIALNTQCNAGNMGLNTINKYKKADYICIDHHELRLATSNQYDNLEDIIRYRFKNEIVSITEGYEGSLVFKDGDIVHIPSFTDNIIDTVGAGDAYLSLTSPLALKSSNINIIGFVGNIAGAIACSYPCNKDHISKKNLYSYIKDILE